MRNIFSWRGLFWNSKLRQFEEIIYFYITPSNTWISNSLLAGLWNLTLQSYGFEMISAFMTMRNLVKAIQFCEESFCQFIALIREWFAKTGTWISEGQDFIEPKFLKRFSQCLRNNLRELGADLIVVQGNGPKRNWSIGENHQVQAIFFSQEWLSEEAKRGEKLVESCRGQRDRTERFVAKGVRSNHNRWFIFSDHSGSWSIYAGFRKGFWKKNGSKIRGQLFQFRLKLIIPVLLKIFSSGPIPDSEHMNWKEAEARRSGYFGVVVGGGRCWSQGGIPVPIFWDLEIY